MNIREYLKTVKYFFFREWDFLLYKRRKLFYFLIFTPLVICALIIGVFSNPVIREIPIALIDEDNSEIEVVRHPRQIVKLPIDIEVNSYDMIRIKRS